MPLYVRVTANESDVNVANNTSKVTCKLQYKVSSTTWQANCSCRLVIDGTTYNSTCSVEQGQTSYKTVLTKSKTVTHGSDGSKKCAYSGRIVTITSSGTVSDSGTLTLTTIKRGSSWSSVPSTMTIYNGASYLIDWARDSSSFLVSLTWSCNGSSGVWVSKKAIGSFTFKPTPSVWFEILGSNFDGASATATLTLQTYSSDGDYLSKITKTTEIVYPAHPTVSMSGLNTFVPDGILGSDNYYVGTGPTFNISYPSHASAYYIHWHACMPDASEQEGNWSMEDNGMAANHDGKSGWNDSPDGITASTTSIKYVPQASWVDMDYFIVNPQTLYFYCSYTPYGADSPESPMNFIGTQQIIKSLNAELYNLSLNHSLSNTTAQNGKTYVVPNKSSITIYGSFYADTTKVNSIVCGGNFFAGKYQLTDSSSSSSPDWKKNDNETDRYDYSFTLPVEKSFDSGISCYLDFNVTGPNGVATTLTYYGNWDEECLVYETPTVGIKGVYRCSVDSNGKIIADQDGDQIAFTYTWYSDSNYNLSNWGNIQVQITNGTSVGSNINTTFHATTAAFTSSSGTGTFDTSSQKSTIHFPTNASTPPVITLSYVHPAAGTVTTSYTLGKSFVLFDLSPNGHSAAFGGTATDSDNGRFELYMPFYSYPLRSTNITTGTEANNTALGFIKINGGRIDLIQSNYLDVSTGQASSTLQGYTRLNVFQNSVQLCYLDKSIKYATNAEQYLIAGATNASNVGISNTDSVFKMNSPFIIANEMGFIYGKTNKTTYGSSNEHQFETVFQILNGNSSELQPTVTTYSDTAKIYSYKPHYFNKGIYFSSDNGIYDSYNKELIHISSSNLSFKGTSTFTNGFISNSRIYLTGGIQFQDTSGLYNSSGEKVGYISGKKFVFSSNCGNSYEGGAIYPGYSQTVSQASAVTISGSTYVTIASITIPYTGIYSVTYGANFKPSASTGIKIQLTTTKSSHTMSEQTIGNSAGSVSPRRCVIYRFEKGETVKINVALNNSKNAEVTGGFIYYTYICSCD